MQDGVKINALKGGGGRGCTSQASFERHRGDILCSHDDINTCVRNQRDYTLELFEWVEEGFRVRMEEWRKVKERRCGFHVSVALTFPVMQGEHLRAVMRAYEFLGLITVSYKTFWHWGRRLIVWRTYRECSSVAIGAMHICIINEMWQGMSWVCLHEGENVFVHGLNSVHVWMLAPH